ncbi:nucleoside deaminase [Streptomyces sp. NPDC048191]|uniref:nucleoside deaminase n=1 Tax=Streptomyces sp. NPDC048191 TaxID=3155484 RepID=UPI0033DCD67F
MVKDAEPGHPPGGAEWEDRDAPFGSVAAGDRVPAEDRNRVAGGDRTRRPAFEPARRPAAHPAPAERAAATGRTSGERCPRCAATHARVGFGRIAYVAPSAQPADRLAESGAAPGAPLRALPVQEVRELHPPLPGATPPRS